MKKPSYRQQDPVKTYVIVNIIVTKEYKKTKREFHCMANISNVFSCHAMDLGSLEKPEGIIVFKQGGSQSRMDMTSQSKTIYRHCQSRYAN